MLYERIGYVDCVNQVETKNMNDAYLAKRSKNVSELAREYMKNQTLYGTRNTGSQWR